MSRLLHEIHPPEALFGVILARVRAAAQRRARMHAAGFGLASALLAAAFAGAVSYLVSEFYASGFFDYLPLFLSGGARWQDVGAALGDSLPSMAILIVVACALALFLSARRLPRLVSLASGRFA